MIDTETDFSICALWYGIYKWTIAGPQSKIPSAYRKRMAYLQEQNLEHENQIKHEAAYPVTIRTQDHLNGSKNLYFDFFIICNINRLRFYIEQKEGF